MRQPLAGCVGRPIVDLSLLPLHTAAAASPSGAALALDAVKPGRVSRRLLLTSRVLLLSELVGEKCAGARVVPA